MKICHVSFGEIKSKDVEAWLNSISYHTKILETMAAGHEVISLHYGASTTRISRNGVEYLFFNLSFSEKMFLSQMIAAVRLERPDAIVLHGIHSSLKLFRFVRAFRNSRIYAQHHGEKVFRWPKSVIQKINDRYVKGYLFSSSAMGLDWIQAGQIKSAKRIVEVLEATSSFNAQLRVNSSDSSLTFSWVGRMDANKDPETLIEGFISFLSNRPEAKLFVISQNSTLLEQKLRPLIAGFEKSIELVGSVDHSQMKSWFEKTNFIISTSLSEGSGISVLEAMSVGCIPVLTNIPSFQTITNHGRVGILFKSSSSIDLDKALRKAATLDIQSEQNKVVDHFQQNLSAKAIANKLERILTAS